MCMKSSSGHSSNDDDEFDCSSFCCIVHTKAIPYYSGCVSTYVGLFDGFILAITFLYILRKIFQSNRRARAGYTKNTVALDSHITLLEGVLVWATAWALYQVFNFTDGTMDLPPLYVTAPAHEKVEVILPTCLIYGASNTFMVLILFLLVSDSIGSHIFRLAYILSICYGLLIAIILGLFMALFPGSYHPSHPTIPKNVNALMIVVSAVNLCLQFVAVSYSHRKAPDRIAIRRYACFNITVYSVAIVSRVLIFDFCVERFSSFGLCMLDIDSAIYFLGFAPVVYLTLKRDSQYWMHDSLGAGANSYDGYEDDEERRALVDWGDLTVRQELPIFEAVVIPKTELYLRRRICDRMDISIEVHLWRRQLVIVKRFKLDFLTRDNIQLFKREANVNRRLLHDNVVAFFGVVIDPPCMSIVMEYGCRGDLFTLLSKLRESYENSRRSSVFASGTHTAIAVENRLASDSNASVSSLTDLSSFRSIKIACDIAAGMRYLHSHAMVHCDVKSANVVLDDKLTAKITDFGEAKYQESARGSLYLWRQSDRTSTITSNEMKAGTLPWAAPEVVLGKEPTMPSDVYSFGWILWELITWQVPFVLIARVQERVSSVKSARELNSEITSPLLQQRTPSITPNDSFMVGKRQNRSERDRIQSLRSDSTVLALAGEIAYAGGATSSSSQLLHPGSGGNEQQQQQQQHPSFSFGRSNDVSRSTSYGRDSHSRSPSIDRNSSTDSRAPSQSFDDLSALDVSRHKDNAPVIAVEVHSIDQALEWLVRKRYRPPLPVGAPTSLVGLMRQCWSQDREARPDFAEIVYRLDACKSELEAANKSNAFPFDVASMACYADE